MPVLDNIKWERFAVHVSEGKTQPEAHKLAGFNGKFHDSAASRLANLPEVAARIKELRARVANRAVAKAVEETALTKELVLRKLMENAARAEGVTGGSPVFNRAWELIGKELGMFRDPEPVVPVNLEDLPAETLERMLKQAEAAASEPAKDAAPEPPGPTVVQ